MMTPVAEIHKGRNQSLEAKFANQIASGVAMRIIGRSPPVVHMGSAIAEIVAQDCPVLLVGAPGTGKRFFARTIHEFGPLSTRPFVVLSGEDATMDADKLRRIVDSAINATLFIDALECLTVEMQDLLYRWAFVDKSQAPARVLACSERPLDGDVSAGHFRGELYDVFSANLVYVPSLEDRVEDIAELIEHFFEGCTQRARRADLRGISPEARSVLESHVFFDNVRGLEHAIEHMVAFAQGPYVTMADLPTEMRQPEPVDMTVLLRSLPAHGVDLKNAVEAFETRMILQALERTGWNKNRAAQLLGLNRTTLVEMIKRKRLVPPPGIRRSSFRDTVQVTHELAAE
jgi:DNA-binding NtrC family response regulator